MIFENHYTYDIAAKDVDDDEDKLTVDRDGGGLSGRSSAVACCARHLQNHHHHQFYVQTNLDCKITTIIMIFQSINAAVIFTSSSSCPSGTVTKSEFLKFIGAEVSPAKEIWEGFWGERDVGDILVTHLNLWHWVSSLSMAGCEDSITRSHLNFPSGIFEN